MRGSYLLVWGKLCIFSGLLLLDRGNTTLVVMPGFGSEGLSLGLDPCGDNK